MATADCVILRSNVLLRLETRVAGVSGGSYIEPRPMFSQCLWQLSTLVVRELLA